MRRFRTDRPRHTVSASSPGGSARPGAVRALSATRGLIPRPLLAVAAWAAALLVIGGAGYLALQVLLAISFVLVPCVAAVLLAALLQPVNRWMQRIGISRGLASGLSLLACIVAVLAIIGTVVWVLANRFDELVEQFGASLQNLQTWLQHSRLPIGPDTLDRVGQQLQDSLKSTGHHIGSTAMTVADVTLRVLAQLALGIFVLFFLLYDGQRIWTWLTDKVPSRGRSRVRGAGEAAWLTLSGYMRGTLIIASIHGLVIGFVLYLLGVQVFLPLGLLVFVGSFIPVVGALVAGGLAVLITLGTHGIVAALILFGVLLLEDELEAHVLQPFVVGRYVRLHPLVIVLVLAGGGWLGGVIGTLIAVPVTGIVANAWRPLTGRPAIVVEEARRHRHGWIVRAARAVRRAAVSVLPGNRRGDQRVKTSDG